MQNDKASFERESFDSATIFIALANTAAGLHTKAMFHQNYIETCLTSISAAEAKRESRKFIARMQCNLVGWFLVSHNFVNEMKFR